MEAQFLGRRVVLIRGDIVDQDVDAVVNAANQRLQLGAGVAGAIRRAGGSEIQQQCDTIGFCEVGQAVITSGGKLIARHVIHAVGPRMGEGDEDRKLGSAVRNALRVASQNELQSIALPAISSGVFGFPIARCAQISVAVALDYRSENAKPSEIRFVLFDEEAFVAFQNALRREAGSRPGMHLLS